MNYCRMNDNDKLRICFAALTVMSCVLSDGATGFAQGSLREKIRERIQERIRLYEQKSKSAESSLDARDIKKSLVVEGAARTYLVHLPVHYKQGEMCSLVFVLHGGTGNAEGAKRMSQMDPKADREGFIVVYPNGTGKFQDRLLHWNDGSQRSGDGGTSADDIVFFRQLIKQLEKDYSIDPRRIYATGLSNGAIMVYRLGCELSDKLAAIAPVSGALNYNKSLPANPLSVIIFHGTADEYVPYNGGTGKASGGRKRNDQSVAYAVGFWVKHNGCNPIAAREEFGNIIKEQYSGGKANTEVVLYTVKGEGHSWPGGIKGIRYGNVDEPTQEISATNLMWEFFQKHPKE